ncbi:hypothetical protein B0J12DRAFT_78589 [Macrophomina phaseolina]|uniref:Apple domain-containing protein n=1 Tax=Macrophomina phaseolina TaxID=35725 RepID=A0ABQ8GEK2_9PEZI|nr:hypothetical protein B0J12DRAFT_78589 [Macrophomina phaseolina]
MIAPVVAVLLCVAGFAAGQSLPSTYTSENCFTEYGRASSVSVLPTSWNITTVRGRAFARGKTTPVSTLTPPPVTATSTLLVTETAFITATESQETDTETTTTTFTVSSIVSSVSTFTTVLAFNSTTTLTSTTTIPTQPGFTPVAADIVAQGEIPSRRKRWQPNSPRWRLFDNNTFEAKSGSRCKFQVDPEVSGLSLFPPQAPTAVQCSRKIRIESTQMFWKTASTTATITAQPSTITTTTTSTTTITSSIGTLPVDATTTITSSTTTTISTTTTSVSTVSTTITNTMTVNAPIATSWAACAANNTITRVNGDPIIWGVQDLLVEIITDSATSCCETCQITVNCTTSAYYVDGGNCLLGNATGEGENQFSTTADETSEIFALSNGPGSPAGNWVWEGVVDGLGARKY